MTSEWRRKAEKYLRENPKAAASVATRLLDDFSLCDYVMTLKEFDEYLDNEGGRAAFWDFGEFRGNVTDKDAWVYLETDRDHLGKPLYVEGIRDDSRAGAKFVEILDSLEFLDDIENGGIPDDYLPREIRLATKSASTKRKAPARKTPTKRKAPARKKTGARR
ncbi:MAG: hypothetical protein IKP53_08255 [Candidatus Methanomethylophilaceae archaeon]|nr:hypothetical protein [Candidatus Methanomethylophilaceae archaeon]